MEVGKNSQKQWQLINEEKLSIGIYKYREDIKLKRKLQDVFHYVEGIQYQQGAFQ